MATACCHEEGVVEVAIVVVVVEEVKVMVEVEEVLEEGVVEMGEVVEEVPP